MKKAVMVLWVIIITLSGCGQTEISSSNSGLGSYAESVSSQAASSGLGTSSMPVSSAAEMKQYVYDDGCAFYVFNENHIIGALTDGRVIQVCEEYKDNIEYGYCCKSVTIQVTADGTESIVDTSELYYQFDYSMKSSQADAPRDFVEYNLARHLNSGSQHAITAYDINDIQVESGAADGPIVFTVNYSITPARYATGYKDYNQYLPSQDGPVPALTGLSQKITLLYIDHYWIPYSDGAGLIYSYLREIPNQNPHQKNYQDETAWLFETDRYLYSYDKIYDKEEDEYGPMQYTLTLKQKDKTNGSVKVIWTIRSFSVYFLTTYGDDLYFQLHDDREWEWFEAGFIRISDSAGKVVQEDASNICAVTDELIYCGKDIGEDGDVLQIFSMKDKKFIGVWEDVIVYYIDSYYDFTVKDGILIWDDYDQWHHFDYKTGIDILTDYC